MHIYESKRFVGEQHQNNNLKVAIAYANFLGPGTTFFDIQQKSQITAFLNTKVKPSEQDPEKRWITTYNHYLRRIKLFYRWLYNNQRGKDDIDGNYYDDDTHAMADWETPPFARIREKREPRGSAHALKTRSGTETSCSALSSTSQRHATRRH